MTQKRNIKKLSELNQWEMPVNMASSWDSIAAGLDAQKRKRRFIAWFSAASVILLVGVGIYFWVDNIRSDKEIQITSSTPEVQLPESKPSWNSGDDDKSMDEMSGNSIGKPDQSQISSNAYPSKDKTVLPGSVKERDLDPISVWYLAGVKAKFDAYLSDFLPQLLPSQHRYANPIKDDSKPEKLKVGWEVFAGTSPSFVNKLTQENKDLGWRINRRFDEVSRIAERTSAGYQFNAGIQMNLGNHLFIQSGFSYSEKQEWVKYNHTLKDFTIVRESERRLEYAPLSPQQWVQVNFEGNNRYRFAEIPLLVGTRFNSGEKLEWRTRGGLSYWRLLGKSGGKIDPTSLLVQDLNGLKNYRNNNLGIVIYSGIYYKLNPQWSIMAEPSGSLSLTNLTMNAPIETRPYQYGLNLGLQYRLK